MGGSLGLGRVVLSSARFMCVTSCCEYCALNMGHGHRSMMIVLSLTQQVVYVHAVNVCILQ